MAFKEKTSLDAEVTTPIGGVNRKTGKKNPSSIEGYYLGTREVESTKSRNGKARIHFLQTSKGNVGVWGKTDLDRKIDGVSLGTMIRVTHTGMKPTPNGEMYKYKVEVDEDNTIFVSGPSSTALSNDEDDVDDFVGEDTYENDSGVLEDQEPAVSAVAANASKERAAKLQSLLKTKKA